MKGIGVAAVAVVALAGCMHVTDATVLAPNGSSTMTEAITFSPKLLSQLGGEAKLLASIHAEIAKHALPSGVKVAAYTDPSAWHGVKVTVKLANVDQLREMETARVSSTPPLFSNFSVTHEGNDWSMIGRVNKGSLNASGSSPSGSTPGGMSVKQLEATGFKYEVTFTFPGKVLHDNATSRSGSTLTWNMLEDQSAVEAAWVVG
jgi:hypothetical protein